MNTTLSRTIITSVLFLIIFLSGFWLSRSGKPYQVIVFTFHKLIALGVLAFLAVTVYRTHQTTPLEPLMWIAFAFTVVIFVATIVTGGLLSIDKPMPSSLTVVHNVFPFLSLLSSAGMLYLLSRLAA